MSGYVDIALRMLIEAVKSPAGQAVTRHAVRLATAALVRAVRSRRSTRSTGHMSVH